MLNSLPDILRVSPADPGVGENLLFLLPNQFYYQLISLRFRFVTANLGLTRTLVFNVADISDILIKCQPLATHVLNQSRDYTVAPWGQQATNTDGNQQPIPFPINIYLKPNWNLSTSIGNLHPQDQISNVQIALMRWAVRNV